MLALFGIYTHLWYNSATCEKPLNKVNSSRRTVNVSGNDKR